MTDRRFTSLAITADAISARARAGLTGLPHHGTPGYVPRHSLLPTAELGHSSRQVKNGTAAGPPRDGSRAATTEAQQ